MAIDGRGFPIPQDDISMRTCGGVILAKARADHHGNLRHRPTAFNNGPGKTWNKTAMKFLDAIIDDFLLLRKRNKNKSLAPLVPSKIGYDFGLIRISRSFSLQGLPFILWCTRNWVSGQNVE